MSTSSSPQPNNNRDRDQVDGVFASISIGDDPKTMEAVRQTPQLLTFIIRAKVVCYFVELLLLFIVVGTSLGALIYGVKETDIFKMMLTFALGNLLRKGPVKVGKYTRAIAAEGKKAIMDRY